MSTDKREAIISASRKLFRTYGVKKTSIQDIAREADIAVGTVYLYFKSKDEIVAAGVEEYRERHQQQMQTALASPQQKASSRLRNYILERFRTSAETRKAGSHAAEIARAVVKVQPNRFLEERDWFFQTVRTLLEQGRNDGEFHVESPEKDTLVFLYSIAWFFPYKSDEFVPEPEEEKLLLVIDWFLAQWSR